MIGLHAYSMVLLKIHVAQQILKCTVDQWNVFLKDNQKWMGNAIMTDGMPIVSFKRHSPE